MAGGAARSLIKLYNKNRRMCIMEFIKNLFKNDEKAIGLCSFKKKEQKIYTFAPQYSAIDLIYNTNTKNNFLLS